MTLRIDFAFPGDLATPTGGYGYDRRVIAELSALGCDVRPVSLPASFPDPSAADLAEAGRLLSDSACDGLVIDGLAFSALPADMVARLAPAPVALVHHPLFLEAGLAPENAARLRASEQAALMHAGAIVTTSRMTAGIVAREFDVASERLFAAEPGVDEAPRARKSDDGLVRLVAVGSLLPRKAYQDLVHALAGVEGEWRLDVVGSLDLDPDCARSIKGLIAVRGLSARVKLEGALPAEAVAARYATADVFVTSSHFEGYGMAIAEAIARGLPVVMTREVAEAGAAPDDAALVYPAGDVAALRDALNAIVGDRTLREKLAARAWDGARNQPRWRGAAETMLRAIAFAGGREK